MVRTLFKSIIAEPAGGAQLAASELLFFSDFELSDWSAMDFSPMATEAKTKILRIDSSGFIITRTFKFKHESSPIAPYKSNHETASLYLSENYISSYIFQEKAFNTNGLMGKIFCCLYQSRRILKVDEIIRVRGSFWLSFIYISKLLKGN